MCRIQLVQGKIFKKQRLSGYSTRQARNQGGGIAPAKFSKHCIAILTFVETYKE